MLAGAKMDSKNPLLRVILIYFAQGKLTSTLEWTHSIKHKQAVSNIRRRIEWRRSQGGGNHSCFISKYFL